MDLLPQPHCWSTYADFVLVGDDFDPGGVTTQLGLDEAELMRQGLIVWVHRAWSFAPARERPVDTWRLSTGGLDEPPDDTLERHLRVLLEVFESRRPALDRLRAELGLEAWFDCYWCASALPAGPSLSAETLGRVAALGAHLALDLATTPDAPGTGPGDPAP